MAWVQAAPAAAATGGEDDGTRPWGPPSAAWRGSAGRSAAAVAGKCGGRLRGSTPRVGGGAGTVAADGFAGEGRGPRRGRGPGAASPPWRRGRETPAVADAKAG